MKKSIDGRTLTLAETEVVNLAGDVATKFAALPVLHPDEQPDVTFHVHAIQALVLARAAYQFEDRA